MTPKKELAMEVEEALAGIKRELEEVCDRFDCAGMVGVVVKTNTTSQEGMLFVHTNMTDRCQIAFAENLKEDAIKSKANKIVSLLENVVLSSKTPNERSN